MLDSALELQESGWEELRKEARKIEGDLDVKLSSYAKLAARFTHSSGYVDCGSPTVGPSRSWKSMEMEIESLLEKLLDINDSMSRCAASAATTTSVTQKLARHRDILHEYTQEFRRTKGNLNNLIEHSALLNSVRDDITESKVNSTSLISTPQPSIFYLLMLILFFSLQALGTRSPRQHLLRERASIHGSITQIDEVINQAQATRSVLGTQRALFGAVQRKVKQMGDKFPVIRGLLGAIRRKHSKDSLILAAVIAACTLFLIIYWLSK
ncbi:Golgi SNAP receptor complex member 1-2 [Apostasia shenzhenica]|uniref:Golgi SNAP receptor complex member 1-2 n=1 Tax=Apostasia shenzhenica TaxID=1088818 RepID=A0A2I0BEV5_9ASPA|nr:Golgi SNAP receptor complex member 1-2 [Apostasia shenzhenica]